MSPPMTPTRRWPQTLLLTALSLLIAAATIMLACNPAAQPAPAGEDVLPAAQIESGGEEPAAEPKEPPATAELEQEGHTNTPTAEPTDTPTPYPTQCIVMPQDFQHLEEAELKDGQIRRVRRDGLLLQCEVVTPTPPIPTPKYPQLGPLLSLYAQEAEAAQAQAGQEPGAGGAAAVEIPLVYLRIDLSANTEEVVAWLQRNGIPLSEDWVEGDKGYIVEYAVDWELGDDFIYAWVPASLLVALSQQEGVTYMEDVGYLFDHTEDY